MDCASAAITTPQAATYSSAGRHPTSSASGGSAAPANAAPAGHAGLLDREGKRQPTRRRGARQQFGRGRRDRAVAQADDQRRDGEHRHPARRQQRNQRDADGAEHDTDLRHPDRAAPRDEVAGSEARRHRADVEQADKDADQLRGHAEVAGDLRRQHRRGRAGQRGEYLNGQRRGQRNGRSAAEKVVTQDRVFKNPARALRCGWQAIIAVTDLGVWRVGPPRPARGSACGVGRALAHIVACSL